MSDEQACQRVHAHLLLSDTASAVREAEKGLTQFPDSKSLLFAYIQALAAKGEEQVLLETWQKSDKLFHDEANSRHYLEMLAWGVLNKAKESPQQGIQINSLIGAALTHDAKALPLIQEALRSSSAMMRIIGVKLATQYGDGPLQEQLEKMVKDEKVWYVRSEVLKAVGTLHMVHLRETLKEIIASPKTLAEEKAGATIALVQMYDGIPREEMQSLVKSPRAGLRQLACEIAAHLDLQEYAPEILSLVKDTSPDVRAEALYTLGLLHIPTSLELLQKALKDSSPSVAITAAWLALLQGQKEGSEHIETWLESSQDEWRRLAAAALAVTGSSGSTLASYHLKKNADPYVRATLAMGLIGQRVDVKTACDELYAILQKEKDTLWMWEGRHLFSHLSPSRLFHIEQIPNYPQVVDQMARLQILSMLCALRYPLAEEAIKGYLKDHSWGITGAAAMTLLQEGQEEALDIIRQLLDEKEERVRVQAALILALMGNDPAAIKVLQESYWTADREMKVHILEAIGHIGDAETIPFLLKVLREPFQTVRVVAASALIQCLHH